jgi:hypothetical protein
VIICVAVATKSMMANETTREIISEKELQDSISFLSKEKSTAFIEETVPKRRKMIDEMPLHLTVSQRFHCQALIKQLFSIIAVKCPDLRSGVEIC